MRKTLIPMTFALLLLPAAATAAEPGGDADQVLLLRHALLVGGRDASEVPLTGEARSAEELAQTLAEWEPGTESEEIRELFALEGLSEVVRQALVLPATGGPSNSVYVHDGVSFEVRFDLWLGPDDTVSAKVAIRRDGVWLAAPTVRTQLGERAIVSTTNGPEAPFLFLVFEVDRVSRERLELRGLRYAGREDLMTVEGDVLAPRPISKARPAYTEEARQARLQGVVVLRLIIDQAGDVTDIDVLKGLPLGLTESAIEKVRQWKFAPATLDGKPVAVIYNITINFRLEKGKKPPQEPPRPTPAEPGA